ncbi:Holliday junction resolvase RecU [Spiroplasma endosymbiont of Polydrusus cervinus]
MVHNHHGISSIIIYFHIYNRYFILSYQKLIELYTVKLNHKKLIKL